MKSRTIHTRSEEETIALGERLAAELPAEDCRAVDWQLGRWENNDREGHREGAWEQRIRMKFRARLLL